MGVHLSPFIRHFFFLSSFFVLANFGRVHREKERARVGAKALKVNYFRNSLQRGITSTAIGGEN